MSDGIQIEPKRILIADDESSARDLLRAILERSGYDIFEARDGEEALTCATRFQPDLVILDLQMPKLDGCSVASRLRSLPPFRSTPILALSAAISPADNAKLMEAGFSGCVAKPIKPAKLRWAVSEMVKRARVQQGT